MKTVSVALNQNLYAKLVLMAEKSGRSVDECLELAVGEYVENYEDIYKTDLKGNVALVIGGEGSGVKKLTKQLCDKCIALPIRGKVNSLNASVACGIVVYEALRQRL